MKKLLLMLAVGAAVIVWRTSEVAWALNLQSAEVAHSINKMPHTPIRLAAHEMVHTQPTPSQAAEAVAISKSEP